MHILIIPSWYPLSPSDIGGSFFREQALGLVKHDCQVGVISTAQRSLRQWSTALKGRYGLTIENDSGLPTLRWHGMRWFPYMPSVTQFILIRQGLKLFKKYVAQYGMPDILHAHSTLYGGVIAHEIHQMTDIPYVITEHSSAFMGGLIRSTQKKVAREAVIHASHLIAVSPALAEFLQTFFGVETGLWLPLPNTVSSRFIPVQLNQFKKSNNTFTFLCVAGLTPNKAIDNLILAFAEAFKNTPHVTLRLGGQGPERENLENLAKSVGITSQINFLGALTRERVVQEMANTDIFVLPSHIETFGVVIIEALAMGKPVIATRCGGPESILRTQDGELVPKDNIQALREAMQKIMRHINDYNPQEIRDSCLTRFGENVVTTKLKAIYRKVLEFDRRGQQ